MQTYDSLEWFPSNNAIFLEGQKGFQHVAPRATDMICYVQPEIWRKKQFPNLRTFFIFFK